MVEKVPINCKIYKCSILFFPKTVTSIGQTDVGNSISMELPFGVIVNGWDLLYVHQHQRDLALEFV
ncbi:hypothetical protein CFP56_039453 [Quercus suber]|uniref:Uncharacterized protein n=1 Tax=Quercus suber TaxID=58331 RepID=A0AAW0J0G7_QUESU